MIGLLDPAQFTTITINGRRTGGIVTVPGALQCVEIIEKPREIFPHCGVRLMDDSNEARVSGKTRLFFKVVWIIASLLIPLVGFIAGVKYLFTKGRRRYGCVLLVLGVISISMWGGIIGSDSGTDQPKASVPTKTPQEIKAQAISIGYDPLYRNIETHVGKIVHFRGEVSQVIIKRDDRYDLRLAMDGDYDKMVYVIYRGDRVLEGDTVEIWGRVNGLYSYKSIFGAKITLPEIKSLIGVVTPP